MTLSNLQMMLYGSQPTSSIAPRRSWSRESTPVTTRGMLSKLLEYPAIQAVQLNKSSADHMMPYSCRGEVLGTAALAIIEEKPELGTSGEGSVQGSFSFIQHWNDQRVRHSIAARAWFLTCNRLDAGMLLSIVHRLGCRPVARCPRRHNHFPCHRPPPHRLHLARWRSCHRRRAHVEDCPYS